MSDLELLAQVSRLGIDVEGELAVWGNAVRLLAAFDAIGRDGAVALLKVDGVRENGLVYTVLVSGGRLPKDAAFRKDGADLQGLLREALAFYVSNTRPPPLKARITRVTSRRPAANPGAVFTSVEIQPDGSGAFRLLYLDQSDQVIAEKRHVTVESAQREVRFEFELAENDWVVEDDPPPSP
ncbi:MAG: hypothetical protein Q8N23_21365 [Archangium sp.]|nr:hypothetical protein [Archangium sp.]MDP3155242.1 hypothetical protein [Archangium sp.]MDP3570903.1 hypothetical protein [Archangium sp.]